MARDLRSSDIAPLFNALKVMYNSANQGAQSNTLTVIELKRLIDLIHNNFNIMKSSWRRLRDRVGGPAARAMIASSLDPTPADIAIEISNIQTSMVSLLDSYQSSIYGSGTAAFFYSYTLDAGLLTGGHSENQVAPAALTSIKTSFSNLAASLLVMAPVE